MSDMSAQDIGQATEFPPGIGKVARREPALNGYTGYEQLTARGLAFASQ